MVGVACADEGRESSVSLSGMEMIGRFLSVDARRGGSDPLPAVPAGWFWVSMGSTALCELEHHTPMKMTGSSDDPHKMEHAADRQGDIRSKHRAALGQV